MPVVIRAGNPVYQFNNYQLREEDSVQFSCLISLPVSQFICILKDRKFSNVHPAVRLGLQIGKHCLDSKAGVVQHFLDLGPHSPFLIYSRTAGL